MASNYGRLSSITGLYIIGNATTDYLSSGFIGTKDLQTLSNYYLEKASFLKMDNMYCSYDFGQIYKKINFTMTAAVQNLFVWSKYSGIDPEVVGGIDNTIYPRPRVFSLSFNLGL